MASLIKSLPADARPREKLIARGAASLADAELLALLLRTGYRGHSALALAQTLLDHFGGWPGLLAASPEDLKKIKGLGGKAKRAEIAALMEIARRALMRKLTTQPVFEQAQAVKDYTSLQLAALDHEVFAVMFLDVRLRLIAFEILFRGTLSQTAVHPREVVKRALALHASAVVLAHNHPSGAAEPSRADELLTASLRQALQLVDIRLIDHVIVGAGSALSFAERGLLA